MKKIALLSVAVAALAAPAFAADDAASTTATTSTTNAVTTSKKVEKVELKDGNWAMVSPSGKVTVSKDGGKTWAAAPDGTWETKTGDKITTKDGKKV